MNPPAASDENVLEVIDLHTHFSAESGEVRAVDGVTFRIKRGRTLALVGESGCGKSVTSYSILRLIQQPGRIVKGKILLHSRSAGVIDIAALAEDDARLYEVRGGLVSMIFQEPSAALSPVHRVGDQIAEAIQLHRRVSDADARTQVIDMMRRVGISAPERRVDQFPHELSGGMRQRVVIAMALVCQPELLIADEPTTALDVTVQSQILQLIKQSQAQLGCSVLFITHDFGVVAQTADEVAVMYLGRIVEQGPVREVLRAPRHPYTRGLLRCLPSLGTGGRLAVIPGSVPSPAAVPPGCPFHPRCEFAQAGRCDVGTPPALEQATPVHAVACIRHQEINP